MKLIQIMEVELFNQLNVLVSFIKSLRLFISLGYQFSIVTSIESKP